MNDIMAAWNGKEKLWKVFWLYNFLLGTLLLSAMDYLVGLGTVIEVITYLIVLVWAVWVLVSLWRCAFNAKWRIWGYLARALVVLTVLMAMLALLGPFVGIDPYAS